MVRERAGVPPDSSRRTPNSNFTISCGNLGPEDAPRLWDFALGGVNAIRQAVAEDEIDCDMQVQDALYVAATPGGARGDLRGVRRAKCLRLPEHALFAREPA